MDIVSSNTQFSIQNFVVYIACLFPIVYLEMSGRSRKSNNNFSSSRPNSFLGRPWLSYSLMCKVLQAIILTISFSSSDSFEDFVVLFFKFLPLVLEHLKVIDALPVLLLVSSSLAWFGVIDVEGADCESLVVLADSEISIYQMLSKHIRYKVTIEALE